MTNPKLRFRQDSDWQTCLLKDVAEINPQSEALPEAFFYIDLESVKSGRLVARNLIKRTGAPSRAQRVMRDKDVLFQMVRPYQQNNFFVDKTENIPYVASTGYAQLRSSHNDPKFMYYALHQSAFLTEVLNRCTGGTYPAINSSDLGTISVGVPGVAEQKKLADFFTALDDKIALAERKLTTLQTLKSGLMQKIFNGEIRVKREDGSEYPEWQKKKLGDVAPLQRGFDLPNSELKAGEYPVVYSKGVAATHSEYKCEGEAVIVGRSGSVGTLTYLTDCKYWPHNTTLWVTDFKGNGPKFVYYLYEFIGLDKFATGTGVPTLNRNDVHDYETNIPSVEEQNRIVAVLSAVDNKIRFAAKKVDLLKQQKQAFMQQMFV